MSEWSEGFFIPAVFADDKEKESKLNIEDLIILRDKKSCRGKISLLEWLPAEYSSYSEKRLKLPRGKYKVFLRGLFPSSQCNGNPPDKIMVDIFNYSHDNCDIRSEAIIVEIK